MNEIHRAQKWIADKLTGAVAITAAVGSRIFADQAPERTAYPIVIFNLQAASDVRGVGTVRLMALPLFQIKLISKGSPSAAVRTAADAIDDLFQKAVTEISEGFVFSARREQPISYIEQARDSSQFFTHYGGLYRLFIYPQA